MSIIGDSLVVERMKQTLITDIEEVSIVFWRVDLVEV